MSGHPSQNSSNSYNSTVSDQSTSHRVTPSSTASTFSNSHSFGSSGSGGGPSGSSDNHLSPHHQPTPMDMIKQERSPPDVSSLTMKNVSTILTVWVVLSMKIAKYCSFLCLLCLPFLVDWKTPANSKFPKVTILCNSNYTSMNLILTQRILTFGLTSFKQGWPLLISDQSYTALSPYSYFGGLTRNSNLPFFY